LRESLGGGSLKKNKPRPKIFVRGTLGRVEQTE